MANVRFKLRVCGRPHWAPLLRLGFYPVIKQASTTAFEAGVVN